VKGVRSVILNMDVVMHRRERKLRKGGGIDRVVTRWGRRTKRRRVRRSIGDFKGRMVLVDRATSFENR
jgi:hypothetical protein